MNLLRISIFVTMYFATSIMSGAAGPAPVPIPCDHLLESWLVTDDSGVSALKQMDNETLADTIWKVDVALGQDQEEEVIKEGFLYKSLSLQRERVFSKTRHTIDTKNQIIVAFFKITKCEDFVLNDYAHMKKRPKEAQLVSFKVADVKSITFVGDDNKQHPVDSTNWIAGDRFIAIDVRDFNVPLISNPCGSAVSVSSVLNLHPDTFIYANGGKSILYYKMYYGVGPYNPPTDATKISYLWAPIGIYGSDPSSPSNWEVSPISVASGIKCYWQSGGYFGLSGVLNWAIVQGGAAAASTPAWGDVTVGGLADLDGFLYLGAGYHIDVNSGTPSGVKILLGVGPNLLRLLQ